MQTPPRRRRDFPYYKVQLKNNISKSWKDVQKIFDTTDEAKDYISKKFSPDDEARIMVIEEKKRYPLND